ncbi:MAG: DNA-processing protein DprA [Lachnospiraceae bacterium]|nr:DNA-processing protein DprA [Lachnospiraceae bacterium]
MKQLENDEYMLNLWFCNIEGVGNVSRRKLLEAFHTIANIYDAREELIKNVLGDKIIKAFYESKNANKVIEISERLNERKIKFVYPGHEDYPKKLLNIYDYPMGLYVRGNLGNKINEFNSSIAIVGSRVSSAYGREIANNFARNLAMNGISIISGLARGIDSAAHKGALVANGHTIAVLGCGINVTYPKENIELFLEVERNGAIISEYGLDVSPNAGFFPCRNRIISGLSDGVCVVEAKKKSGSLITVDCALEQGKQVYSVPGRLFDQNSEGTNNLIKQGAYCVCSYKDILSDLFGEDYTKNKDIYIENKEKYIENKTEIKDNCENDKKKYKSNIIKTEGNVNKNCLAPMEKMVYSCLSLEPTYIDDVINMAGLGITRTISTLYMLEEKKVVKQPLKGYYIVAI